MKIYKYFLIYLITLFLLVNISYALTIRGYLNDSTQFTLNTPTVNKTFSLDVNLTIQDNINHSFESESNSNGYWDVEYVASNNTGFLLRLRIEDNADSGSGPFADDQIQKASCNDTSDSGFTPICTSGCGNNIDFNQFHNYSITFNSTNLTAALFVDSISTVSRINLCTNITEIGGVRFSRRSGEVVSKSNLLLANNKPPTFRGNLPNLTWPEDTSIGFNISGNFSDANNDTLTYNVLSNVENITITINSSSGIINLTPSSNFSGVRYVIFLANDSDNITLSNNVTLNVTNVNDMPIVSNVLLNTTDSLNLTNGSLIGSWVFSDIDNDAPAGNETLWYINGTENQTLRNLTLILPGNTTKTQNWTFSVRVFDGTNFSVFVNSTSLLIQDIAPLALNVTLINTDSLNRTNGSLIANFTYSDADGDAQQLNETLWYIDGIENISLRNTTSISAANTTKDQSYIFSVRVSGGSAFSDFSNSTPLTIQNSAPTHSAPLITSNDEQNRKNGTLTCSNQSTNDLDNDIVTNFIKWHKNNALVGTAINSTALSIGNYSKNDNITCEITPNDGSINGTALNSTNFTVLNAAPLLNNSIQNKTWNEDSSTTLNLSISFIDIDEDNLTYNFTPVSNIAISINNSTGIATLTPDANFNGIRDVFFFAFDGTNLTNSNNVTLTVNDVAEPSSGSTSSGSSGGGGGGSGGGRGIIGYICDSNWECESWSECIDGKQTRECRLVKVSNFISSEKCPQNNLPEQSKDCIAPVKETKESCDDGIQNQNEESIDCGGVCSPCPITKDKAKAETEKKKENNLLPTGQAVRDLPGNGSISLAVMVLSLMAAVLFYAKFSHRRLFRREKLNEEEMKKLNETLRYKMFKK